MARHGGRKSNARRSATRCTEKPASTADLMRAGDFAPTKRDIKRSKGRGLGSSQRDSEGGNSAWNRSPSFWTDPRWSRTVSDG